IKPIWEDTTNKYILSHEFSVTKKDEVICEFLERIPQVFLMRLVGGSFGPQAAHVNGIFVKYRFASTQKPAKNNATRAQQPRRNIQTPPDRQTMRIELWLDTNDPEVLADLKTEMLNL
ncbi:translation Initiation factor eIF- 4e-like, partial [Kipferlia bialata]